MTDRAKPDANESPAHPNAVTQGHDNEQSAGRASISGPGSHHHNHQGQLSARGSDAVRRVSVRLEDGRTMVEYEDCGGVKQNIFSYAVYVIQLMLTLITSVYGHCLFAFQKSVGPNSTEYFYGWMIICCNIGVIVSGVMVSLWMSAKGRIYKPLIIVVLVTIAGHIMLAASPSLRHNGEWILFGGRTVIGFGIGGQNAVVALIILRLSESHYSSIMISFMNSLGVIIASLLVASFTIVAWPGYIGIFNWDLFASTALVCIICGLVQLILVLLFMRHVDCCVHGNTITSTEPPKEKTPKTTNGLEFVLYACCCVRFLFVYMVTFDRSLTAPFSRPNFNWTTKRTIVTNNIIQACIGTIDFFGGQITQRAVPKYLSVKASVLIGVLIEVCFFMFLYPWPVGPMIVEPLIGNHTLNYSATSAAVPGPVCQHWWCTETHRIEFWQYSLGKLCLILGIVFGVGPNSGLFSNIVNTSRTKFLRFQRYFTLSSHFAIMTAPLTATWGLKRWSPRFSLGSGIAMSAMIAISFLAALAYVAYRAPAKVRPAESANGIKQGDDGSLRSGSLRSQRKISFILPSGARRLMDEDSLRFSDDDNGDELHRTGSVELPAVTKKLTPASEPHEKLSDASSIRSEELEQHPGRDFLEELHNKVAESEDAIPSATSAAGKHHHEKHPHLQTIPESVEIRSPSVAGNEQTASRSSKQHPRRISTVAEGVPPPSSPPPDSLRRRATLHAGLQAMRHGSILPSEDTRRKASAIFISEDMGRASMSDMSIFRA